MSPILDLAVKHGLKMVPNDLQDIAFYDEQGRTSFQEELDAATVAYARLVIQACMQLVPCTESGFTDFNLQRGFLQTRSNGVLGQDSA